MNHFHAYTLTYLLCHFCILFPEVNIFTFNSSNDSTEELEENKENQTKNNTAA